MKLTNLHIFLIILLALVLCSTLGGNCGAKEGYEQRYGRDKSTKYANPQYGGGYDEYNSNLDDSNVSATNISQGLNQDTNNPYYNANDYFHNKRANHKGRGGRMDNRDSRHGRDNEYGNGDLNVGDYNDNSGMYSDSNKRHHKYTHYDKAYHHKRKNNMFDSVSTGAMNGSLFNSANSYSIDESNGNGNGTGNGISRNQIPDGQEDLYILKSQTVPPMCPACPDVNCNNNSSSQKCPPCPACARCPDPPFECKKVPNYGSSSIMNTLPLPWTDKLDFK